MELKEKASNYAEENVINILKDAFARVYADGYRDGYKDCKMKVPFDLHDNKTELVNHDMPIITKKMKDNFLPTDALNALMLSDLAIDDREGFSCFYTGPVVLDKSRYYVKFELYESGTASGNPTLSGSTLNQSVRYEPYSTIRIPFEWQVKAGSLLRARIVDGKYEDQSSGWRTVIL